MQKSDGLFNKPRQALRLEATKYRCEQQDRDVAAAWHLGCNTANK